MSCTTETITLANSFFQDSANKYVVKNYTTTKDSSGKDNKSCLPTAGTPPVSSFSPSSINSTSGTIKSEELIDHVGKWLGANDATAPTNLTPENNDPVSNFASKSAILRSAIKAEYCYYHNRYAFMLNDYLLKAASTSTATEAAKQKDCVIYLNSVLNQILQVYQGLINARNTSIQSYYTASGMNINSLNADITKSRTDLENQSSILKNANLETDVQSAMIEYSIEKNQSSRNLLAIYGFMNLVAAGLLVYLYRSTRAQ